MSTTFLQPKREQLELEHCTKEKFVKTNHPNPDPPHEPQEASGLTFELLHLEKKLKKKQVLGNSDLQSLVVFFASVRIVHATSVQHSFCFAPLVATYSLENLGGDDDIYMRPMCSRTIFGDDNHCTSRHNISSRDETNMSTSSACSARMGLRQIVPFK